MSREKKFYDYLGDNAPVVHLHIHASNLKDLTFARGVLDLIKGVNSDDAEFVRALTNPEDGLLQDIVPVGRVQ